MKKLFLMFALAGSIVSSAQTQPTTTCCSSDSVVVQPSEVRPDSIQCLPPDSMCCDTIKCAEGSSAADGKADHDRVWWVIAGSMITGALLVTAVAIRNNNRAK